ncbi:hypothetical protein LTR37_005747 [Vermiconidia calcicola]|uniref:Uncharacterized protein n=1 Tax=Vermiconidia calcicola TaxID=1690605 RepID=A0ACC3NIQ5_9PEZI|nr:hypothetical protein LTR37_005747 [Vermiconidia calcicola]
MDALNQAQKDGVVVGLKAVAGVAPRLDIDKFLNDLPDTFNLFCLALYDLMNDTDSTKIMGYYQIAASTDFRRLSGMTSPTWHRPYLSMIEQTIFAKMLEIAEKFPQANKQTYREAAKKFRMPYWDYYRPRGKDVTFPGVISKGTTSAKFDFSLPQIFAVEKVMLKTPTKNQLELHDNPLHLFSFPKAGSIPLNQWNMIGANFSRAQTQRHPSDSDPLIAINNAVNKAREPNAGQLLNMISDDVYDRYETFAFQGSSPGASGSLESVHGLYHVLIGGQGGHMSSVPVAAFDPIFWLHHCQIDRWLAIWQAAHPNSWFSGDQDNLLPFRVSKNPARFWNSRQSISTQDFGYTYPDLVGGGATQVEAAFKNHYAWSVRTAQFPTIGNPPTDMAPLDLSRAQVYQFSATFTSDRSINFMAAAPQAIQQPLMAASKVAVQTSSAAREAVAGAEKDPQQPVGHKKERPSNRGDKKKVAKGRSFRNLDDSQTSIKAPSPVEESKVNREWFIDDVVERLALNGSFTIYYFLGDPPNATVPTSSYLSHPTLAAASHIFAAPVEACDNCGNQQQQSHLVTSTAPITPMLLDYVEIGHLPNLRADSVKPFLVRNLRWRVVTVHGGTVDPRDLSSLKIGVSSKLAPLDGQGRPTYEEFPEVVEEIIENSS